MLFASKSIMWQQHSLKSSWRFSLIAQQQEFGKHNLMSLIVVVSEAGLSSSQHVGQTSSTPRSNYFAAGE